MRKKYYIVLIMLLLLSCLGLTACQNIENEQAVQTSVDTSVDTEEFEEEDELVFAVNVDSSVSEAFLECVWMNRSKFWGGLVFQGLLIADGNIANVRPDLCEEFITSPDGTKYVFLLREDVYWHDGEKLTTEDVVWSIESSMRAGQVNGYIQKVSSFISLSMSTDTNDKEGLYKDANHSKRLGMNAKSAIHPNQIEVINEVYLPTEKEINRIIQILNRRSKNNPCLIGEPGVGKTAIAQGLALKIANQDVPAKLLNKEVYLLDMTAIIAGTQFRGQFEARMKSLVDECKVYGNIILVIDEIHNIIGAGDAEHSMNAANILKPSLSNGEIQLIGTTTLKEYRKYIEKDTALERRFQPVTVNEPSVEETIKMLEGIKHMDESDPLRAIYVNAIHRMMDVLIDRHLPENVENSNGILLNQTYALPQGIGIDEHNIWGDYFFMEALHRMLDPDWALYW